MNDWTNPYPSRPARRRVRWLVWIGIAVIACGMVAAVSCDFVPPGWSAWGLIA